MSVLKSLDINSSMHSPWTFRQCPFFVFAAFCPLKAWQWQTSWLCGYNICSWFGRLIIRYRAICCEDYYDYDCSVFCIPQNNPQHGYYTCDNKTGVRRAGFQYGYCTHSLYSSRLAFWHRTLRKREIYNGQWYFIKEITAGHG